MNPSYLVPRRDQGEEIRFSPEPQRRSSSALGLCGLVVGFVLGLTCHGIFTEVTKLPPPTTVEATPAPTPTPEPYPTTKAEDAAGNFGVGKGVGKDLFMDVEMRRYWREYYAENRSLMTEQEREQFKEKYKEYGPFTDY